MATVSVAPQLVAELGGRDSTSGRTWGEDSTSPADSASIQSHAAVRRTLEIVPAICRGPFLKCLRIEEQLARFPDQRRRLGRDGLDAWSVAGRRDLTAEQKTEVHAQREVLRGVIHRGGESRR